MSQQGYRSPTFRSIVAGVLAAVVLLVALAGLPTLIKASGVPFLIVPSLLGLTKVPGPSDVRTFNLAEGLGRVEFREAGHYALYSSNWDLLETTEAALQSHAEPWLKVRSSATGSRVPVAYVERGLRPYDTPFAPGRPIFTFDIPRWGLYDLVHPGKPAVVALIPDHVTGKERQLAVAMTLQVCAIVLPLAIIAFRRFHQRRQATSRAQAERRKQADAVWQPKRDPGRRLPRH